MDAVLLDDFHLKCRGVVAVVRLCPARRPCHSPSASPPRHMLTYRCVHMRAQLHANTLRCCTLSCLAAAALIAPSSTVPLATHMHICSSRHISPFTYTLTACHHAARHRPHAFSPILSLSHRRKYRAMPCFSRASRRCCSSTSRRCSFSARIARCALRSCSYT